MGSIRSTDIVDLFNSRIRNPANSGISWGSNRYPPDPDNVMSGTYSSMFGGSSSGLYHTPPASRFRGDIRSDTLRATVLNYARAYTAIRRVSVYLRFEYNNPTGNWYSSRSFVGPTRYRTVVNTSARGHLNSGYRRNVPDPSRYDPNAGKGTITWGETASWFSAVGGEVRAIQNQTVSINRTYCHSSCHNSCHSSCHGDGPGNGGGV